MFMILPKKDSAEEATPVRVKKACNRCRIKKIKCTGRLPCARCTHDKVVCRLERGLPNNKELSRSYISSLEEQQLSLLNALRQLCHSLPGDARVERILEQLNSAGFDTGSLQLPDQLPEAGMTRASVNLDDISSETLWHSGDFRADAATLSGFESLLANSGTLEVQSISELGPLLMSSSSLDTQSFLSWDPVDTQFGQNTFSSDSNAPLQDSAPYLDPVFESYTDDDPIIASSS